MVTLPGQALCFKLYRQIFHRTLQFYEVGIICNSLLPVRKLRHERVEQPA